jgi:hypothetical protein
MLIGGSLKFKHFKRIDSRQTRKLECSERIETTNS